MIPHTCHVDCKLEVSPYGNRAHVMYAAVPNSAAGRYQYDANRVIFRMGMGARKAYRATGQDESRNVRVWNHERVRFPDFYPVKYGIEGRRFSRELAELTQ